MQLHQPSALDEIARLNAGLLVVSFAGLNELREWVPYFRQYFLEPYYKERDLGLPEGVFSRTRFVSDPQLSAYHAYGMGRNSVLRVYGLRIVWQYFRWGLQRKPLRMPGGDTLQRGGDFVVNARRRLTLAHLGRDQTERPTVADVLAALRT